MTTNLHLNDKRQHQPVMVAEVLHYLAPKPNQNFVDATVGLAGHTKKILECTAPSGRILAIDRDPEVIGVLKQCLPAERVNIVCGNFADLVQIVKDAAFGPIDGILFDLGFLSVQVDNPARGFSFCTDGPLDMRFDQSQNLTAAEIVNRFSEKEICRIIWEYGEERNARKITKAIIETRRQRPIRSTLDLAEIVSRVYGRSCNKHAAGRRHWQKIHPATRTFQALRIAVNDELECLKRGLAAALEILSPDGRIVTISFHSGEDRIVKNFFRDHCDRLQILTKKPVRPSVEEVTVNPRARSAKLRAAQKY